MIEKLLKDWKGEIEIGDKRYTSETCKIALNTLSEDTHIFLHTANKNTVQSVVDTLNDTIEYRVTVKKYMTEPASPGFDFMSKWNNNNPMPLRTMVGTVEKETRGMVYMKLHGQAEPVIRCMRCGRVLTNPVSQHYGIGPECMSKLGLVCDIDDVDIIKKKLVEVIWEGWIIKSAITEKEEV
jgi:hypothetical protein